MPKLYEETRNSSLFNVKTFSKWVLVNINILIILLLYFI